MADYHKPVDQVHLYDDYAIGTLLIDAFYSRIAIDCSLRLTYAVYWVEIDFHLPNSLNDYHCLEREKRGGGVKLKK